jgi:hypothetical protein
MLWWTLPICVASYLSCIGSAWSSRIKIISNLESNAAGRFIFFWTLYLLLYLPYSGLAAAKIEALAFKEVVIPAFAIETVCCYIT